MATIKERIELRIQERLQLKKQKQEKIDCEIESIVKNFLEKHKQFYIVPKFDGCDVVLEFTRWDLTESRILSNTATNRVRTLSKLGGFTFVYLKNSYTINTKSMSIIPYILKKE